MQWIQWYDFIIPSNPFSALLFGLMISIFVSIGIWFETKEWKIIFIVLGVGAVASIIVVLILDAIGLYR